MKLKIDFLELFGAPENASGPKNLPGEESSSKHYTYLLTYVFYFTYVTYFTLLYFTLLYLLTYLLTYWYPTSPNFQTGAVKKEDCRHSEHGKSFSDQEPTLTLG